MQLTGKNEDMDKKKGIKILKLNDEKDSNKNLEIIKYKSGQIFVPFKNNLKTVPNKKKSYTSKELKLGKIKSANIYNIKNIFNKNNIKNKKSYKIIRPKTKKNINNYYYEDDSSSLSFTENINNNQLNTMTNSKKKLFINGKEISNSKNLLYYNTISTKNREGRQSILNIRPKPIQKYNQKIFNRNNNILDSYEKMKKFIFKSEFEKSENSEKNLKQKFSFNFDENFSPICYSNKGIVEKNKKIKLIKGINQLNNALSEIKFYIISDKIDREIYREKFDELEKKMDFKEDRAMITKDILFEKFNNADNQNDYINHATNKNQYVNKLITSYININEKKTDGLLNKKFVGGLKKLNVFDMKDAMIRNVIGENNYFIKYRINRIEEGEISKNRKNLGDNMKHIKQMVKYIYNKKMHIGEGNK